MRTTATAADLDRLLNRLDETAGRDDAAGGTTESALFLAVNAAYTAAWRTAPPAEQDKHLGAAP